MKRNEGIARAFDVGAKLLKEVAAYAQRSQDFAQGEGALYMGTTPQSTIADFARERSLKLSESASKLRTK